MSSTSPVLTGLEQQKAFLAKLKKENPRYGLAFGAAFVRGIRDIGYKHSGTAIDELIDNSYQAGADTVHVVFGFEGHKSEKKPAEIAIIDNGHAMPADMIRVAMAWGGTHREGDRSGFGRFGYGLPSACVSLGQRYTVYSKVEGEGLFAVTVDIEDIAKGKYTTADGVIEIPNPRPANLPKFVENHLRTKWQEGTWTHGTIVVIEKFDRLTWVTANALQENLLRHFGVVYNKLRGQFDLWVNDRQVEPIDPTFLTPGYRWYDLDADRAEAPIEPMRIAVKNPETKEVIGHIDIRVAYLPPGFASVVKGKKATGQNASPRFTILKEYQGFMFYRMGRLIDVVQPNPVYTFKTNDRYLRVEIEFPAALDEFFNIPTSKQRVDVAERIWTALKEAGLSALMSRLAERWSSESSKLHATQEHRENGKRASEEAMERVAELAPPPPPETRALRQVEGEKRLVQEAEKRAVRTGKTVEQARKELEFELQDKAYKVVYEDLPGGAFFRVEPLGATKVLFINQASRFFKDLYMGSDSNPAVRSALEVLLFAIGDRMLESAGRVKDFYAHEIPEWSRKIQFALGELSDNIGVFEQAEVDEGDDDLAAA
jgi:hypothetical protein